ncbi:uncharacterized protein LOC119085614 [Bradysia coprophila]|uniref:uncharacterized protein LOC119085614 n=1 Tax=Bradysia coprophila TaxID=38358 RepID=UPI00187DA6AA|nr:uncharacterized protein LOC119085614 [Bradysia coprophila]
MSVAQLTFAQKALIVYKLLKKDTPESIAAECNLTVDEIHFIAKNHWPIVEVSHFLNNVNHSPVKGGLYPLMENILYCWYIEQQDVTNKELAEKAKVFLDVLNEQPRYASANLPVFSASKSWIDGFKTRFNIASHKRNSTGRGTDTPKKKSSVRGGRDENVNDSNSESSLPEKWENFNVVDQSSAEEEVENESTASNYKEIEKVFKTDSDQSEPDVLSVSNKDVNQRSTDLTSIVADNANNNAVNGNLNIPSSVSLTGFAGQDIRGSHDVFSDMVANSTKPYIDLTHEEFKIVSVVSLKDDDRVRNVDGRTAKVVQDSTDDFSYFGGEAAPTATATIDLTESNDDELDGTSIDEENSRDPLSQKRKRSVDITDQNSFVEESRRPRKYYGQFQQDSKRTVKTANFFQVKK